MCLLLCVCFVALCMYLNVSVGGFGCACCCEWVCLCSCFCMRRCVGLWGVGKDLWVLLYVWIWMCPCDGGGVSLLGSVNNTFRGTAVLFHRLFQVENCFQNPEMAARLSPASCRAVGRTRLSGRVADRPSACRDPRPTLWPLTPARHRPPGPDCRDVFRNN